MRYAAFISYSSIDRSIGEALQKALEAYVLPAPLRGGDFGHGPLSKRLGAVFRDRWDANANADLGAELRAALHASGALVVLCSPAAARSHWVGEEISEFKRIERGARIFPVLLDGLPARLDELNEPQGAFHPALYERWDAERQGFEPDPRAPLAPDLREGGDGMRFTVMKLVAALTGVPLTTLTQRQAEAERRERNLARGIAVAMSVLALAASAGGWASWQSAALARQRLESAVEMAARRVDDAAAFQDRYGVPSDVIQQLLDGARKDFDELTADAAHAPTLALQQARLDRLLAGHYESAGDGAQHRALAERALDRLARVPTERHLAQPRTWLARLPQAQAVTIERLQALSAQAQAAAARGDTAAARGLLGDMAAEADARRARDDSPAWRSLAAQARAQRARLAYEAGQLEPALADLEAALLVFGTGPGAAAHPAIHTIERSALQSELAEMLLELGRHDQALALQQSVVDALRQAGDTSPESQRSLATALARRGDMQLAATRNLTLARQDYLAARTLLSELAARDGARTDFKRDLSLAHERVGDAALQAGDLPAARQSFAACLALRRELALRNPAQVEWRRDLSVALERMGDIEAQQARPAQAQAAYAEALAIRQAAHDAAPQDAVATRDLAVLWMRIGRARTTARADIDAIHQAYAPAIALMQPLAEQASADSRWRRDLAVAHAERGEALRQAGRRAAATADFQRAWSLVVGLRAQTPQDEQLRQDADWLRQRLAR